MKVYNIDDIKTLSNLQLKNQWKKLFNFFSENIHQDDNNNYYRITPELWVYSINIIYQCFNRNIDIDVDNFIKYFRYRNYYYELLEGINNHNIEWLEQYVKMLFPYNRTILNKCLKNY